MEDSIDKFVRGRSRAMRESFFKSLIFFTVAAILLSSDLYAGETVPAEAREVAKREVSRIVNTWDRWVIDDWFMPSDKASDVHLGDGYGYYRIEPEKLVKFSADDDFYSVLTFIYYTFPIYVGDEPRTLISLVKRDNKWRFSDLGGDPNPITEARERWPKEEGYNHSYALMLRGPDFIILEKGDTLSLYSFRKRSESTLDIKKGEDGFYPLLDPGYVTRKLRPRIKARLEKRKP